MIRVPDLLQGLCGMQVLLIFVVVEAVSYGVDYVSALDARQCKGYLE